MLRKALSVAAAALTAALALLAFARDAPAATPRKQLAAATVLELVAKGGPVVATDVEITGELSFPADVRVPITLRHSTFHGTVSASSVSFHGLVDFSGSTFERGADFADASFGGPLLFLDVTTPRRWPLTFDFAAFAGPAIFSRTSSSSPARFGGRVSFRGADFRGPSRFHRTAFGQAALFGLAAFGRVAIFGSASFAGPASFGGAEFGSVADFNGAGFDCNASFDSVHFFGATDFTAATFLPTCPKPRSASFVRAHFDGDATFLRTFFGAGATFELAGASRDLDFQGAMFQGDATFSTARLLGDTDFSQAEFHGLASFDQAVISRLDLDRTVIAGSMLVLPDPKLGTGHVVDLRMDPNDVEHVRAGSDRETRPARMRALQLVEDGARSGGDLRAANEARVLRSTLARYGRNPFFRALDWAVLWGLFGYFVRWAHPLLAIAGLLLLGIALRSWCARRKRHGWAAWAGGIRTDLGCALTSARKLAKVEARWPVHVEAVAYTVLLAVFLVDVKNVWPPVSDVLKGVLP